MQHLAPDILYTAMARPIIALGVPYMYLFLESLFILGAFIVAKKLWILGLFALTHSTGYIFTQKDPHFFAIFLINRRYFVKNRGIQHWGGVSYHA